MEIEEKEKLGIEEIMIVILVTNQPNHNTQQKQKYIITRKIQVKLNYDENDKCSLR